MAELNRNQSSSRQIIKSFEAEALKKRHFGQKVNDYLASSFGTVLFLLINLTFFVIWISVNTGFFPGIAVFDPYPFTLLTMAVSLEAIFLSIIVLMAQNRQSFISSLREELDFQVNLIAEREITKILRLVSELHKHHGVKSKSDPELEKMLQELDKSYIKRKLEEQLLQTQKPNFIEKLENLIPKK